MPLSAEKRVLEMLTQLWVLPVDIRLSAHMSKLRFTSQGLFLCRRRAGVRHGRPADLGLEPRFQVAVRQGRRALVALVLLSPIMVATAIAIKLDSKGPVFFKQKRHGFNNELIEVFKFRSMRTDMADANCEQARDQGRSARHAGRPLHPQDLDRRAAAVLQRAARRTLGGRPAAACAAGQGRQQALLRGRSKAISRATR